MKFTKQIDADRFTLKMGNLWKKDSSSADAEYTNLFANLGQNEAIKKWDRQLDASDWKHRFLMYSFNPKKDNQVSEGLREEGKRERE